MKNPFLYSLLAALLLVAFGSASATDSPKQPGTQKVLGIGGLWAVLISPLLPVDGT